MLKLSIQYMWLFENRKKVLLELYKKGMLSLSLLWRHKAANV